jgi:hypothetical protein
MISAIYIEQAVSAHPTTQAIRRRFPDAQIIPIERYSEVFNRKAQNFRLQKNRPALILAAKHEGFVLPAPPGYGLGMPCNFYMSHMLNCVYDCRYCFLQGMYRSAHYVLYVNFEDFKAAMAATVTTTDAATCFFSGYDCDSLAPGRRRRRAPGRHRSRPRAAWAGTPLVRPTPTSSCSRQARWSRSGSTWASPTWATNRWTSPRS